jgi:hypothetical protein
MNIDEKFKNFELFVHRRYLARFIVRYELFKKIMNIEGSIIECGVHNGGGVMAWAKLSEIFEPYAIRRKVFGFDTFEGFPEVHEKDKSDIEKPPQVGDFNTQTYDDIIKAISDFDQNRYLNQFQKIYLIKGDAKITIPQFVENNPHIIISLLFLDFDLYEPTKTALEYFIPRMPKGSILAFDEINEKEWPGETRAMVETFGNLNKLEIKKFHFDSNISFVIL